VAGRPSTFDQRVFDAICERMAAGETLRAACRAENLPLGTVQRWAIADDPPGTAGRYARARDYLADFRADEIIEIADDSQFPPDDRRVRIDARKWAAAKLNPRLYSDRVQQQHSGDPHNPVVTEVRYRWDEPPKDKPE
jgi:hypothetical protein